MLKPFALGVKMVTLLQIIVLIQLSTEFGK